MMNFSMHFMLVKPSEYTANTTETCSQMQKQILFQKTRGTIPWPLTCSSLRRLAMSILFSSNGIATDTRNIYTRYKTINELSYEFYVGVAFILHSTNYSNTLSKCRKCYLRRQKSYIFAGDNGPR